MALESPQVSRVREARSGLLRTHPFFGILSLRMKIYETTQIPTAGVDNENLHFNPAFVDTLCDAELKGLIAHEVLHLALCHHAREGTRDHKVWNLACDFAINPGLVEDGFMLPPGGMIDPQFKDMSAEVIYEKLQDIIQQIREKMKSAGIEPQPGDGDPDGQAWGDFDSAGPDESADAQESARQWTEAASDAMRAAQSAGKMPANLKRDIEAAMAPKADWRALLRRFMTDQVRVQSTWSKPNKRFYPSAYLPGKFKDGMGTLVIGVDTSGSISGPVLERFAAEINAIAEDVEPAEIHVVYCDAEVNKVETFESGDEIVLHPYGGGGTRFSPVFKRVEAENWSPAALVYLTDLCCDDYPAEPGYPVLWASYGAGGAVAPLGETVAIDG